MQAKKIKLKIILFISTLLITNISVFSQSICFKLCSNDIEEIENNNLKITKFKFYISNVRGYYRDSLITKEQNSFHLIDLLDSSESSCQINLLNIPLIDEITFSLGIDSTTNVSGAIEGDLDPTNNMYWAWQSGYINVKLEGQFSDSKKIEYHLGGYAYPNNAINELSFRWRNAQEKNIYIHLTDFIQSIPATIPNQVMSPSIDAVLLSHLLANSFSNEK